MRKCILCGVETKGSIGAAGIKWPNICQTCKDREDKALLNRLKRMSGFDEVDSLEEVFKCNAL